MTLSARWMRMASLDCRKHWGKWSWSRLVPIQTCTLDPPPCRRRSLVSVTGILLRTGVTTRVITNPKGRTYEYPSSYEDLMDRAEEQGIDCVPPWDKYLDMTEEENSPEEGWTRSDEKRKENKHRSASRELGATNGSAERFISEGEIEEIGCTQKRSAHLSAMGPASVSNQHRPTAQPTSPVMAPTYRHLLHFTDEEMAAAPGIDAETLPEIHSFTESPPESLSSHVSQRFSPRCAEATLGAPSQPAAATSPLEGVSTQYSRVDKGPLKASHMSRIPHKRPTPSPRKMRQKSPEPASSRNGSPLTFKYQAASPDKEQETPSARTPAAAMDESRKGPLSYRTPDFTKVEPRVRFPKQGYHPPRSRRPCERKSLSPEPILVFKSPTGIVKDVVLNTTAGSPSSSHSPSPRTSAPNLEFKGRQQATLLDHLEEEYNRLLTKYAEAENTIDRLRLEAKDRPIEIPKSRPRHCQDITDRAVNLYSDPPKPGYLVQSGLNRDSSTYMKLDFPQAQRAEFNSPSLHPNRHSNHQKSSSACPSTRSPDPEVGQQLARILFHQADKFLQQLQTFDDLLKSKTLGPFDHVKGLSQLAEGLNSLEGGYLLARDEHKVLQQGGAQVLPFDSERELERLIFQCGLRMDELKEQVEQMQQEQPDCEAPPSPPPHPTPSSVPSEGGEQRSPPVPLLVGPGEAVEVSSATEESDEEEETLNSLYLNPLNGKRMDHHHSFKELPKRLVDSQRGGASLPAPLRGDLLPADEKKERRRPGDLEVRKGLPQRRDKSDHLDSGPVGSVSQPAIEPSHPSRRASSQSTTLHPLHPRSSRRRLELGKSHSSSLSSLGEVTTLEKRNAKPQTGSTGGLSQDGVISPETDSGFVCSESSRPTPAAALSSLHQRASQSVLVPQEGNLGNPVIHPVPSTSHGHAAVDPRSDPQVSRDQQRRTRQGPRRRSSSCSLQHRARQTQRTRADSGTSDFGLESDRSHTASEDGPNDQYTESLNSLHHSSRSSSPTATHRHGDSLLSLRSSQNPSDAIQRLQVEVIRLRNTLESYVRNPTPLSSASPAAPAQENYTLHNSAPPRFRSVEQWGEVSRGRRDGRTVDESTLRQMTRKRPSSATRQKPQLDILSGLEPSSPNPPPLVSRCTQTSTAAPDSCSHSAVCSRTHSRQHLGASETADGADSRGRRAPLCPQCLSRHQGRSDIGGAMEPAHCPPCRCCPLCGGPEPSRSAEPDCCRVSGSPTHTSCHVCSPDGAGRSRHAAAAAPPVRLQFMPVCSPPLLLYSSTPYVPLSHSTPSGVRGHREMRTRHCQWSDREHSVDTSLNRAIRAAQHMKRTSGHMARSLATGVQHQELLTQSCSY
uniref:microtubule organization protein AKNA isoform X2 n=1 Tax=Gasterosteus aculeatus aculeatus TaxID=481459 RepID=UPI001A9923AC|nr:microtubule organization protein AKNA isoform X2 [Gasterosteus aculeatus aculeatus]